jgi:AraC family transcriptional regulator, positive regulator of tynA and feaB
VHSLVSSSGRRRSAAWNALASLSHREFYLGDLQSEPGQGGEFSLEKALQYPISLTRLVSEARLSYRRSWDHIRNNHVGSHVLWFVVKGSLKIVRTQGVCHVGAGEAGIIDSNAPFQASLELDRDGAYESYQAVIPADVFLKHLLPAGNFCGTVSLNAPSGAVVQGLLGILISEGERLSKTTARPLVESLLEAVSDCIGRGNPQGPVRQRLGEKRVADIKNYILMNLGDQDLCPEKVAACCGITPRYLCSLLRASGTTFPALMWGHRLRRAREWLASPSMRDRTISEIARMSGFKNAAHFSRLFKATYGKPPRSFR